MQILNRDYLSRALRSQFTLLDKYDYADAYTEKNYYIPFRNEFQISQFSNNDEFELIAIAYKLNIVKENPFRSASSIRRIGNTIDTLDNIKYNGTSER